MNKLVVDLLQQKGLDCSFMRVHSFGCQVLLLSCTLKRHSRDTQERLKREKKL